MERSKSKTQPAQWSELALFQKQPFDLSRMLKGRAYSLTIDEGMRSAMGVAGREAQAFLPRAAFNIPGDKQPDGITRFEHMSFSDDPEMQSLYLRYFLDSLSEHMWLQGDREIKETPFDKEKLMGYLVGCRTASLSLGFVYESKDLSPLSSFFDDINIYVPEIHLGLRQKKGSDIYLEIATLLVKNTGLLEKEKDIDACMELMRQRAALKCLYTGLKLHLFVPASS